jgi:multiple sugar transport system ATP-binding protein
MADRMAVMEKGHIRQLDTPTACFRRSANLFVASFIGSTPMNLLPATVVDGSLDVAGCRLPIPEAARAHVTSAEMVTLGARPEYMTLSAVEVPGALAGTVRILENLGVDTLVTVDVGELRVQATVPDESVPAPGARVWLTPDPRHVLLYRRDDGEQVGAPRQVGDVSDEAPLAAGTTGG